MKTCSRCDVLKRESDFRYHAGIKNRRGVCKQCEREENREWRATHKAEKKAQNAAYYQKHKLAHAALCRKYKDNHPTRVAIMEAYSEAVLIGDIIPVNVCEISGEEKFVQVHFLNYDINNLKFMYVSKRVHKRLHAAMKRTRTGIDQTDFPEVHSYLAGIITVKAYAHEQGII